MYISKLIVNNFRNFNHFNVPLGQRVFLTGPNGCGKSNFLEILRLLSDISNNGLKGSVNKRGSMHFIRNISMDQNAVTSIEIHLSEEESDTVWKYAIGINSQSSLTYEKVWKNNIQLLNRPDENDLKDPLRLTQTYLEQSAANSDFRPISQFFEQIQYFHIIPQIIRYPSDFVKNDSSEILNENHFLKQMACIPYDIRMNHIERIEQILSIVIPNVQSFTYVEDHYSKPHLKIKDISDNEFYENQFSDGMLRMIGLIWSVLQENTVLLLEEPELSLNTGILSKLPSLMYRFQQHKKQKQQIILSTHSYDLLLDEGIAPEDVLLFTPDKTGTTVQPLSAHNEIMKLIEAGIPLSDVLLPYTASPDIHKLELVR
jgi:predicted ATPase